MKDQDEVNSEVKWQATKLPEANTKDQACVGGLRRVCRMCWKSCGQVEIVVEKVQVGLAW